MLPLSAQNHKLSSPISFQIFPVAETIATSSSPLLACATKDWDQNSWIPWFVSFPTKLSFDERWFASSACLMSFFEKKLSSVVSVKKDTFKMYSSLIVVARVHKRSLLCFFLPVFFFLQKLSIYTSFLDFNCKVWKSHVFTVQFWVNLTVLPPLLWISLLHSFTKSGIEIKFKFCGLNSDAKVQDVDNSSVKKN